MLDNYSVSLLIALCLASLSFYIINKANERSAKNSEENIKTKAEELAKTTLEVIDVNRDSTLSKINSATKTMVLASKNASEQITKTIDGANQELDNQLKLIESATKKLKNQMENQEILLEISYSFDWAKSNLLTEYPYPETLTFSIIEELYKNNFYQLKIKSKEGRESYFETDINSFSIITNDVNENGIIDDMFAPVAIINEHTKYGYFKMKFPIKAVTINFLLDQISKGDILEFVLTNSTKNPLPMPSGFNADFGLFTFAKPGPDPVGKIELGIKLRNRKTFKSETTSCTITGINTKSFRCYAVIQ